MVCSHDPPRRSHETGLDTGDGGLLGDPHAAPLAGLGKAAHQARRVDPRPVRTEARLDGAGHVRPGRPLVRVEEAHVVVAPAEGVALIDELPQPRLLGGVRGDHQYAALVETAVDPLGRDDATDLVDGIEGGPLGTDYGLATGQLRVAGRDAGDAGRDPAAVPTRRPESRDLVFEHDHAQIGLGDDERVGRPQACEPRRRRCRRRSRRHHPVAVGAQGVRPGHRATGSGRGTAALRHPSPGYRARSATLPGAHSRHDPPPHRRQPARPAPPRRVRRRPDGPVPAERHARPEGRARRGRRGSKRRHRHRLRRSSPPTSTEPCGGSTCHST